MRRRQPRAAIQAPSRLGRWIAALIAALIVPLAITVAAVGAPVQRTTLAEVEREVMCPTCGTALIVAQSPLADRERAFIRERIARGETKAQIERAMVREFGPDILATPPEHGFSPSVYLVPVIAVLLALLALGVSVGRWRRRGAPEPGTPAPAPVPPALNRPLEDDLARYDR